MIREAVCRLKILIYNIKEEYMISVLNTFLLYERLKSKRGGVKTK